MARQSFSRLWRYDSSTSGTASSRAGKAEVYHHRVTTAALAWDDLVTSLKSTTM